MTAFAEYVEYDGIGLAELVRGRQVTPRELVEAAIEQIERHNPHINAVVHKVYDRALSRAGAPLPDGPFSGVPFLLKDLLAQSSGEPTTASSRFLQFHVADRDSTLVSRYRRAGLISLGKTNTPEFGLLAETDSEFRGPTVNPWDLERSPGGSSGGAAAATAARFVPIAHGGDGGGSIRIPASACGLFGLKPSRGRNPHGPDFSGSWLGMVQQHVVTRTVRDSAGILDVTSAPHPGEPYNAPPPSRPYLEEVGADPGSLRVAFTKRPLMGSTMHRDCEVAVDQTVGLLEQLGHEVREEHPLFDQDKMTAAFLRMVAASTAGDIQHASELTGRKPTADQFEAITWLLAVVGRRTHADELVVLVREVQTESRRLAEFFERYDVLVTPTLAEPPWRTGRLAPTEQELKLIRALHSAPARRALDLVMKRMGGEQMAPIPNTMLFNLTGQPAASLPLHWNDAGLPIGVQLVTRYGDEATLFRLSAQLESARPWTERKPAILG